MPGKHKVGVPEEAAATPPIVMLERWTDAFTMVARRWSDTPSWV